jgi:Resolvase, N terminal domain
VQNYLDGGTWELVGEFTEVESGRKSARPELAKALALCKNRKATLVIARLDRLARITRFSTGRSSPNSWHRSARPANPVCITLLHLAPESRRNDRGGRCLAPLEIFDNTWNRIGLARLIMVDCSGGHVQ